MEKLKVTLSFLISDDIQKVDITVADTNSDKKIHKVYDLLPGYHLENYVKLSYTQFQMN